ncbi:MAG: metallophosphoesterase [Lachnospiraceae bacterium]|nr:metallophosphoesterase [Lachnospiraceae bacterium]
MVKDIILAVVILLILIMIWVAIYDSNRFSVSKYKYKNAKIKKQFRAVVVSDLHNKKYGPGNDRLVDAIRKEKPDIILVAGDIMNGHPQANLDTAFEFLEKIAAEFPIYYGNGNHEMRMHLYPEDYGDRYTEFTDKLAELNIRHLVNAREALDDLGVEIIGLELARNHFIRFKPEPIEAGELDGAIGKPDKKKYSILIAHNPDFFEDYVKYGAELVLSGHIHGGIVRIPLVNKGVLSPNVSFFPKYDAGEYTKGKTSMVVSRGLGVHTIPFRMFNPGDLVVIDFEP